MPLDTGTRFGPYEILTPIGAGGMGEVYRAKDTRLKREVALKVLPESFARDRERMDRFQREAEVLASLNHPNIATIYGVEERALAMELVEGETLRGPLPVDTALSYARQIAEALEYAHDRRVIHRDLKPANVKVTPEGVVKLLDFGLAKAIADPGAIPEDVGNSPTLTRDATRTGVILGTAAYMSPEQANGKPVDPRSDIFSFGSVFYEMLTGKPVFTGESVSDTLASVLKLEPDWDALPPETPEAIVRLLRRCLTKDRKQRLQAIGEARIVLEAPKTAEVASSPSARASRLPWIVASVMALVAAVAIWGWLKPVAPERRSVLRFEDTNVAVARVAGTAIALSRDGTRMAFIGGPQQQIYVRLMDQLDARPLPGTEDSSSPCFSPDGEWISYISGKRSATSQLKKIRFAGGSAEPVAPAPSVVGPPLQSWGEDDNIYFSSDAGLEQVRATGGRPVIIAAPDMKSGERAYVAPQLLPGGRWVLFSILLIGKGANAHRVAALNLQTKERRPLLDKTGVAQYAPTGSHSSRDKGHIVYYEPADGSLMAIGFDVNRIAVQGTATPVLNGVRLASPNGGGTGAVAFSETGLLAYVPGAGSADSRQLVVVDRMGKEQPTSSPERQYNQPSLSPDGERVAVTILDETFRNGSVWVWDLTRKTLSKVTAESSSRSPIWTPDSKSLIFFSGDDPRVGRLVMMPIDESSPPTFLSSEGSTGIPTSVSKDLRFVIGTWVRLGTQGESKGQRNTWILPIGEGSADRKVKPFLDAVDATDPQFSPDGHAVAYQSAVSGQSQIYVQAFPGPGGKQQVSNSGGRAPRWSQSGELFYLSGDRMMAVEIQTTPTLRLGTPMELFKRTSNNGYDVFADGKHFLMVKANSAEEPATDKLNFVVNWFDELRQRVPLGEK